jgi:hypothetical protein
MTRKDVTRHFEATSGVMYSFAEPYYLRRTHPPGNRYDVVMLDIVFKPSTMDDATFANTARRAAWYRHHAWWPGEDGNDTIAALGKPYVSPLGDPVLDVNKLPAPIRAQLRSLRVGMAVKDIPKSINLNGGMNSPDEPEYLVAFAPTLFNPLLHVAVKIASKPNAMSEAAYNDPKRRMAWFNRHAFSHLQGEPAATIKAFSKPYGAYISID